jgi:ferredoxin-like protein FixX
MDIVDLLQPHGLLLRGGFALQAGIDDELLRQYPTSRQLVLIGNAGSAIWPHVARYIDDNPGAEHPLDDWTATTMQAIATKIDAICLLPFGGPPWWPFQRWAQRGDCVFPSPISILIHPDYGLWHAYRAALLLRELIALPVAAGQTSPCESCADQPCLTTCPVGAFSATGYDVETCAAHVATAAGRDCQELGCQARLACPIGADWRYAHAHAAFHMTAFRRAHPGPESRATTTHR